jgi:hypothetical protein
VYTKAIELTEKEIKNYWNRFTISPSAGDKGNSDSGVLTIEQFKEPCNVGFKLDGDTRCPLIALEDQQQRELDNLLVTIEGVLKHRAPKPAN